jgi:hypothetical protein
MSHSEKFFECCNSDTHCLRYAHKLTNAEIGKATMRGIRRTVGVAQGAPGAAVTADQDRAMARAYY